MSSIGDTAIISFPIKFTADAQDAEKVTTPGKTTEESESMDKLLEFVENTDQKGLQSLSRFAKNPSSMMEKEFLGMLGKAGIHGAIAVAIIAMILGTPEFIMTLTRALAVKGGPLNQDFRRDLANEAQLGLTRELQFRRAAGFDVVITNQERGFLLTEPFNVGNSLIDIEKTRTIRLSSNNTKYGYKAGMGS